MGNNAKNVSAGKPKVTGAVFVAPAGSAIPADAVAPLDTVYKCMGYVSEEGVKNNQDVTTKDTNAWGGDVVASTVTGYKETFEMTFIETNLIVLKEYYGENNVTETGNTIAIAHGPTDAQGHPWVIETVLNNGRIQRDVIPNGKIGARGEKVYADGNNIAYKMTINALPGSDGKTAHTYIASAGVS